MRRIASACAFLCLLATATVAWGSTIVGHRAQPTTTHYTVRKAVYKPSKKRYVRPRHKAWQFQAQVANKLTSLTTIPAAAPTPVLLGDQTVEPSADTNAAGMAEAFPFTTKNAGTPKSISVYVAAHSTATTLVAAVFADNGGAPGASIAHGSISSPQSGGWNTVPVTGGAVSAGGKYWVALLGRGGQLNFRDRTSSTCQSQTSQKSDLTSLSSSWSAGRTWGTCPVSAYVSGPVATSGQSTSGTTTTTTTTTTTSTTTTAPPTLPTVLPPINQAAPTVSGSTVDGQPLSSSNGTWQNDPASYTYQWQDCDSVRSELHQHQRRHRLQLHAD